MKSLKITILFIFLFSGIGFSQDTLTVYYDKDWNELIDIEKHVYYRKAFPGEKYKWDVIDFYKDGNVQMTGTYKTYEMIKKHGHFVYYYENSNKASEGKFYKDKNEGKWKYWHENGKKKSEGSYEKNKKRGIWSFWYDNGNKKSEGHFENSGKNGFWKYWYENGTKKAEGDFVNNGKENIWKYYNENGVLISEESFEYGFLSWEINYFKNGLKKNHKSFKRGQPHGSWSFWNRNGKEILTGYFKNGARIGVWTRTFLSGEFTIDYKDGDWDEDFEVPGMIIRRTDMENDE